MSKRIVAQVRAMDEKPSVRRRDMLQMCVIYERIYNFKYTNLIKI